MLSLRKPHLTGDIDFATPPPTFLDNQQALEFMQQWMLSELPCIAGRRETMRNRYMVEVATRQSVPDIFHAYHRSLQQNEVIACLLIFNDPEQMSYEKSVSEVFYYLADQMQRISRVSAEALATGDCLTKKLTLKCPVTGEMTIYDDFECIAFCPQSNNPDDPLYDPLMALPFPAVNISSDMYAFSNFVSDMVNQRFGKSVRELSVDMERTQKALYFCVDQWQRMAVKTIRNYESLTDTSLCPIHVNNEENQWVANHKDPAFAEQVKEVHTHELPVLYGKRIVEEWLGFFYQGKEFSASGLARDGEIA